jgi:hypothetical protein
MAKFPSFLEYLNDKGQTVEKPDTETVPDYHGKEEKSPPGSKVPYKTPTENKAPAKGESGFADMGNQKLNYKPETNVKYEVKPDVMKEYVDEKSKVVTKAKTDVKADYKGKEVKAPKGGKPYNAKDVKKLSKKEMDAGLAKLGDKELEYVPDTAKAKKVMKTESFVNKTKGMSLADFTKYMLEECGCGQVEGEDLPYVTAYTTGKFQPHPPEAIRYISALAGKNDGILENLVSTMVSMGYLNSLLKIIFSYPQAYEELTSLFSDENEGPDRCKSFAGAMSNNYSKFLADQDDLYESVSSPMGFELDDLGEEDADDDEESDDDEDLDSDEGEEDLYSDEDEDSDEDLDSDEGSEEEDVSDDQEGDEEDDQPKPEKRLKKKFAHDHLLDAMKGHEHMFKAMRGI